MFGYLSGYMLVNMLGLTTQVPMVYEVVSNNATTEYRKTMIGKTRVIVRRPKVEITNVLVETSFTAVSFPTVTMAVTNYIGRVMEEEAPEMIGEYHIEPFEMKVQGLDRTLTDKVFAICDYYMQNRIKKHSRHIYDIYKLLPLVEMDERFKRLVEEVRAVRKCSNICPSARDDVDISALLQLITEQEIYKDDNQNLTEALLEEDVSYETAVQAVEK